MSDSPQVVFEKLLAGVCGKQFDGLPELYARETVVRHPMDPTRSPSMRGRAALAEHFGKAADGPASGVSFAPAEVVVHQTADPEVIVAEFEYRGTARNGTAPLAVPCVFVLRVRDGQIVESRDYVDHLAFAEARGEVDALVAAMRSGTAGS